MALKQFKKILILALLVVTATYLILAIYVGKNVYFDNKKKSDAILVLGAKSYKSDKYNPCLSARVEHAAELYKKGYADKIIMSGGDDSEDGKNEASTMQEIAQKFQIPKNDILLENKSKSTFENIVFSGKLMTDQNIKSVIIVTEPFHSPRAGLVAKKDSINYSLSPTLTSQCWLRWKYLSRYFLKEPLAIIKYYISGKI